MGGAPAPLPKPKHRVVRATPPPAARRQTCGARAPPRCREEVPNNGSTFIRFSWDFYGISLGFLKIVYGMLIGLFNFGNLMVLIEMIGLDWDLSWEDF